ncbi:MAG: hypothetical protein N3D11_03605 [Candidatus Sumerlaeia bacterium]|nr:hypothetical protein [Candidatus Sumerlaeia bacterium]
MARSFDFYHPPISTDPSLTLLERRGIWAFGGIAVLALILLLALAVRLDHLRASPRSALETVVWRDWRKGPKELEPRERREVLPPAFHRALRVWGAVGGSVTFLRLHSVAWSLVLIAVVFHLGAAYFASATGALAALLLALSPLLTATSQRIGSAPEAAALLAMNFVFLMQAVFRRARGIHWGMYLLTGALAVLCHPMSIWVILVQAMLALAAGARDPRQPYFSRILMHTLLLAVFAWFWFRFTRGVEVAYAEWGQRMDSGWAALIRLLGVEVFWGTRVYPTVWWMTAISIAVLVVPLVYGGMSIRHRQTQEVAGFMGMCGAVPILWLMLAPRSVVSAHVPASDAAVLTMGPLALWAAAAIRSGLRRPARRLMGGVLLCGGLLVTVWSSRVQVLPEWAAYRSALSDHYLRGRPILAEGIVRTADFEEYLGWPLRVRPLKELLRATTLPDNSVVLLEPCSPLYRYEGPEPDSGQWVRGYLQKHCRAQEILADEFFRLTLWTDVQPSAVREGVNRATFFDPAAWDTFKFTRWFGPCDPAFETTGPVSNLIRLGEPDKVGRVLPALHASWVFPAQLPPGYYHVYIPLRRTDPEDWRAVTLLWTLPGGVRRREVVGKDTLGLSFIWDVVVPGQTLRIRVRALGEYEAGEIPPVAILGVGVRKHFPYVLDLGEPFDDLALETGWHAPRRDGDVSYRWTDARARAAFYLPAAGGIGLNGRLSLSVACRHEQAPPSVEFEVLWDGRKIADRLEAGKQWQTIRLDLPTPPLPGRHELVIRSPIFSAPDPADPSQRLQLGIMVDKVSVE